MQDGVHLNYHKGHVFFFDKIIKPFLIDQLAIAATVANSSTSLSSPMNTGSNSTSSSIYNNSSGMYVNGRIYGNDDVRMFPVSFYYEMPRVSIVLYCNHFCDIM